MKPDNAIRTILKGYNTTESVFSELTQNAEDAKASTVIFVLCAGEDTVGGYVHIFSTASETLYLMNLD